MGCAVKPRLPWEIREIAHMTAEEVVTDVLHLPANRDIGYGDYKVAVIVLRTADQRWVTQVAPHAGPQSPKVFTNPFVLAGYLIGRTE